MSVRLESYVHRFIPQGKVTFRYDENNVVSLKFDPSVKEEQKTALKAAMEKYNPEELALFEKQQIAKDELDRTDVKVLRAIEIDGVVPEKLKKYREALRNVIRSEDFDVELPVLSD